VLRFSSVSLCCKLLVRWFVSSRAVFCCSGRSLVEILKDATRLYPSRIMAVVVEFVSVVVPRRATRLCDLLNLGLVGGATLGLLVLELGHLVVVVVIITLVAHAAHTAHH
jgi:hypothetical protein